MKKVINRLAQTVPWHDVHELRQQQPGILSLNALNSFMAVLTPNSQTNLFPVSFFRLLPATRVADAAGLGPGRLYLTAKRLFDLTVCLLLLPVILPVIAVCGLALWIENPGPIFFTQLRTGRGGYRFRMCKLRTMVTNAT